MNMKGCKISFLILNGGAEKSKPKFFFADLNA